MRSFRVLIVDDEPPVVQFVDRTLRGAGYETTTATDGATAIAAASADGPFDLLLTDLLMPNMTGEALAASLRRDDPDLPVLYLTGYADQLFKERQQLWANETFLDKPTSMQGLREAVSLALFGHTNGPPTA